MRFTIIARLRFSAYQHGLDDFGASAPSRTARSNVVLWPHLGREPGGLVGKHVQAGVTPSSVERYFEDTRVATHERVPPGQRSTKDDPLPVERRELRHRSRSHWVERAAAMGPEVERFIEEVFDSDDVIYQLRVAQQVVRLLEGYPVDRARAASRRARFYGNYSYGGLKNILVRAFDLEPLPSVVLDHAAEPSARPCFARDVQELLQLPLEKNEAPH